MRKALIAISIFIVIFLIADYLFFVAFKKVVFDKTYSGELGGKVNEYLYHQKKADFIVMGNSRAKYQINPCRLTNFYEANGYNIAISGVGGIVYNDMLLDILKEKNRLPKAIILQVDAIAFESEKLEKTNGLPDNEIFAVNGLLPFYEKGMQRFSYYISFIPLDEKWKLYFKSFAFNGKVINLLFNRLGKKDGPNEVKGYVGLHTFLNDEKVVKVDTPITESNKPITLRSSKLLALKSFINVCKENKIKLMVVLAPSYKNALYRYSYNIALKSFLQKNGVLYVDYANLRALPNISGGFYWKDETHLNDTGASIFSDSLNASIGRMLN